MKNQESQNDVLQRERDFHNDRYASESENRSVASKYYRLKWEFDEQYLKWIKERAQGKKVLEIGCGPNINTPHWVDSAAECHGIDLSEVAIEQAWKRLGSRPENVHLAVMNAESMDFEDNAFDVVCGKGIIHHLNTEAAYKEVARVLKPGGRAIFIEPMGHNPFINLYRRLTPNMRTEDEHPLLISEVQMADRYFGDVKTEYQHITSILSAFIPVKGLHTAVFHLFNSIDKIITKVLPFTKKYSWMVLIKLQEPRLSAAKTDAAAAPRQ